MNVTLGHSPNPDIKGGYWSAIERPTVKNGGFPKPEIVKVKTFAEASDACRAYIVKYDLGGGNWGGYGHIWIGSKHVGRVSFNGRVWDNDGKEILLPVGTGPDPRD